MKFKLNKMTISLSLFVLFSLAINKVVNGDNFPNFPPFEPCVQVTLINAKTYKNGIETTGDCGGPGRYSGINSATYNLVAVVPSGMRFQKWTVSTSIGGGVKLSTRTAISPQPQTTMTPYYTPQVSPSNPASAIVTAVLYRPTIVTPKPPKLK